MDIVKLVSLGESQTLEFKRDTSGLESVLKAIVAFANTSGGIILIHHIDSLERPPNPTDANRDVAWTTKSICIHKSPRSISKCIHGDLWVTIWQRDVRDGTKERIQPTSLSVVILQPRGTFCFGLTNL